MALTRTAKNVEAPGRASLYTVEGQIGSGQYTSADALDTEKTLFTAGTYGSRLEGIQATTDDAAAPGINLEVILRNPTGPVSHSVGLVNVPASSGQPGTAIMNIWANANFPFLNASDPAVALPAGWLVVVKLKTTLTAAKTLDLIAIGGDF